MYLPNALWRRVAPDKVTNYLLNPEHPLGGAKARYFSALGFRDAEAEVLMSALFDHPIRNEVEKVVSNAWGTKYVIRCTLQTPDGSNPCVCSIWIIEGDGRPRFVTVYPA